MRFYERGKVLFIGFLEPGCHVSKGGGPNLPHLAPNLLPKLLPQLVTSSWHHNADLTANMAGPATPSKMPLVDHCWLPARLPSRSNFDPSTNSNYLEILRVTRWLIGKRLEMLLEVFGVGCLLFHVIEVSSHKVTLVLLQPSSLPRLISYFYKI